MDINEQFKSLIENSTEINEAEEVDIKTMERKPQLSIKYWEKLFKAKAETAFDGIHGYIVILNGNTDRYKSVTLDYLSKGPDYRWIEFGDRSEITIGF